MSFQKISTACNPFSDARLQGEIDEINNAIDGIYFRQRENADNVAFAIQELADGAADAEKTVAQLVKLRGEHLALLVEESHIPALKQSLKPHIQSWAASFAEGRQRMANEQGQAASELAECFGANQAGMRNAAMSAPVAKAARADAAKARSLGLNPPISGDGEQHYAGELRKRICFEAGAICGRPDIADAVANPPREAKPMEQRRRVVGGACSFGVRVG